MSLTVCLQQGREEPDDVEIRDRIREGTGNQPSRIID